MYTAKIYITQRMSIMGVKKADINDINDVADLIAKFRVELKSYKNICASENIEAAKVEFTEYIDADFPIYFFEENSRCLGYLVCRVDKPVVWVESLFVLDEARRKGIASALFTEAEQLALSYGESTVYNYVHPNNDGMIAFLRTKGYTVINLLEIRKKHKNEIINEEIIIRNNSFDY